VGLLAFEMAMLVVGIAHAFKSVAFFAVPLAFVAGGLTGARELLARWRGIFRQARPRLGVLGLASIGFGCLVFAMIYFAALSPDDRASLMQRRDELMEKLKPLAKQGQSEEAEAEQRIAIANLDAKNKGTVEAQQKARTVRAEAQYKIAREKCDDLSGNAKDVCVKEAKAAETKAKAEAKADRRVAETRTEAKQRTADARKDAAEASRDADYRVARERCDQLAGDAKDACMRDVRAKFGRS